LLRLRRHASGLSMINYTERLTRLMEDVVRRVPLLSFIDMSQVLVFARFGRAGVDGAFATCHSLNLPTSEPGYYFWRDRRTGRLTRRSEWFVTKSPDVRLAGKPIGYLISFVLPRFCEHTLKRSRKGHFYGNVPGWMAKLDTVVHELYHISPHEPGIRRFTRADGSDSLRTHGPGFYEQVSEMVRAYLASGPDPSIYDFLQHDFAALTARHGTVVATTFRNFPSFPKRYRERVTPQPAHPHVRVEVLKAPCQPTRYSEADLLQRQFTDRMAKRLVAREPWRAA
jgi:hypothetical protein